MKLSVGNLPFDVTEEDLEQAFSRFESIASIEVQKDDFEQPTGFAEVVMTNEDEAKAAIKRLNGADLRGRRMTIHEAGTPHKFSMHDIIDI